MNPTRLLRTAAVASLALMLVVLGAALRPAFVPEPSSAVPVLSEVETGFVQDMLAHHNQALLMIARLDSGVDPIVAVAARQIAESQRTEIGMMVGWLRMAHAATINPDPMSWMHPDTPQHHRHSPAAPADTIAAAHAATMPGMATQTDLDALAAARGRDAEVLFLELMRRHHYGGIQMAQAADRLLDGGIVEQAAREMYDTQAREAGLLALLLDQRPHFANDR
ncbi:DUF305 domain-containing protein [Nocardia gamkensis]|uniref:DUF305 domain-containing protein n=1 Tax=Nocardia gamkensis TaxID=352869 RepID=A0A7X6R4Q3_9NOCA|nr:DUF305 domain-containing protein [Nocardia gamkensis]NKY28556.1 DUF305 domain-containing protein [Nocardia gamkensis]NQE71297.1 hypothetical protein [Nocardia gamkensis]